MIGPDKGYVDILNHLTVERLKELRETGKDVSKTPLRPSAAGSCERELAYNLMEFHKLAKYDKPLNTADGHRIFSLGHSIEYNLIKEFRDIMGDFFQIKYQQQSLSWGKLTAHKNPSMTQFLEGSLDLVLWSDKFKCIADVKSKKDKYSSWRNSSWDEYADKLSKMRSVKQISENSYYADDLDAFITELHDPFFAANFLQLNLYANSDFIIERGIDHGAIFQYNKNTSQLREVRFRPSPTLAKYVIDKMQAALNAVDNGNPELAVKEFQLGSIKCAFCSYTKMCWSEEDPKKAFFKNLPNKRWATDIARLEDQELANELFELYDEYLDVSSIASQKEVLEQSILDLLVANNIDKIKFDDGNIYEVKFLKSPREHFELRRSKN